MKRTLGFILLMLVVAVAAVAVAAKDKAVTKDTKMGGTAPEWSMNATAIEACSCSMFCQCYFNTQPAGHAGHEGHEAQHFCRFNMAYKVNQGVYKGAKLDGAKFWIYGDLGGDFSKGQMDWAVTTFDKSTTKEQRDAIVAILPHLFPVKWSSFTTAEGDIEWVPGKDAAYATLDGGKTAEVRLTRFQGMTNDAVVIDNLKYWGAPRNDGFVLMPNSIEAVRTGDKPFEFKGGNGFMITVDINSNNAPPAAGM